MADVEPREPARTPEPAGTGATQTSVPASGSLAAVRMNGDPAALARVLAATAGEQRADLVHRLQRTSGNRAVTRMLSGATTGVPPVQERSRGSPPAARLVQRQLQEAPTKMVTSEPDEISFPADDEPTLDGQIKSRQGQKAPDGGGKYLGLVTYKNLPPAEKEGEGSEANLARRAAKYALLEVITTDVHEKGGTEIRVRVPLDDTPVVTDYAMVVLRFDKQRNVEVEYAGKDVQAKGSLGEPEPTIARLEREFGVEFVTDGITAKLPGAKAATKFAGKPWSANDAMLLGQTLPLMGAKERKILEGCKIRRLAAATAGSAAGFYTTADKSINLSDAALPFGKEIWFGEGGKFFTRGVHTLLHEIGHALHFAESPAAAPKGPKQGLEVFKLAVLAESKRRTKKGPGKKFPPPGITPPTDYAGTSWSEFYADTYSIYITNPAFLDTPEFRYLSDFFAAQFP